MIINFTYDTNTKEYSCTMDGQAVENFTDMYFTTQDYCECGPRCVVNSKKEEDEVETMTTVVASEREAIQNSFKKMLKIK